MPLRFQLPSRFAEDEQARRNFDYIERFINEHGGLDNTVREGAVEVVADPANLPDTVVQTTDIGSIKAEMLANGAVDLGSNAVVGNLVADRIVSGTLTAIAINGVEITGSDIRTTPDANGAFIHLDTDYGSHVKWENADGTLATISAGGGGGDKWLRMGVNWTDPADPNLNFSQASGKIIANVPGGLEVMANGSPGALTAGATQTGALTATGKLLAKSIGANAGLWFSDHDTNANVWRLYGDYVGGAHHLYVQFPSGAVTQLA